jgi:adenylate cyclase
VPYRLLVAAAGRTDAPARTRDIAIVAVALALPLIGLGLLVARPELDIAWEHHPGHFWLVLTTAIVNVVLAYLTNEAANRRADARLALVSLCFLTSAGFLALHALATPGVLLPSPNVGFVVATPVGLGLSSIFAAASISPVAGPRAATLLRHRVLLRRGLLGLMLAWAVVSLLRIPPLNGPVAPQEASGPLAILAFGAVVLYAISAVRYAQIFRRRRSPVALAIVAALVLLAEAMIAIALSRNWHLSWWEWHVLMTLAFALIALGVRAEYARTGSLVAIFRPIYLETTLARIDRWHARAIGDLAALETRGEAPDRLLADLRRDGASSEELALLAEAAREIKRVDELFSPYLPEQVAQRLRQDPGLARPGGTERTVSVLFADLAGFTAFSETRSPTEVIAMLNAFWEAAVPVIHAHGGSIEHFAGDGILVLFNATVDQPDHAERAARCALDLLRASDAVAAANAAWPRFRIGLNTGPAVVGNVGAAGRYSFATIGDTTNLGARLMSAGEPGQAVIGPTTREQLAAFIGSGAAAIRPLGPIRVKGKREPVEAWVLEAGAVPRAS